MINVLIKTFWQSSIVNGRSFLTGDIKGKVKKSKLIIHFFYFIVLITSTQIFVSDSQFPDWSIILGSKDLFEPIWSVRFLPIKYWDSIVRIIMLSFLFFSFLGVMLWNRYRFIRIGVFLSMFLYVSLISSFGKIDHGMHIMLLALFLLIFIPNEKASKNSEGALLKIFFGIQTLILLTYFSSGVFKFYGLLNQEFLGLNSVFSYDSYAQNICKTSFIYDFNCFFSSFILNHSSFAFSIILILGYSIELLSIYVIFKPKLHRIWGVLLIGLHTGILLSIGPNFYMQMSTVGIFLLFSPFKEESSNTLFKSSFLNRYRCLFKSKKKNKFIVFYDGECLMCNRFLHFVSNFDLPNEMKICKIQSERYNQLLADRPDLKEVDSIVVIENLGSNQFVRIKANALIWVLSRISILFLFLSHAHKTFPYIGNSIYDISTKYRKKTDSDNCPLVPNKLKKLILE